MNWASHRRSNHLLLSLLTLSFCIAPGKSHSLTLKPLVGQGLSPQQKKSGRSRRLTFGHCSRVIWGARYSSRDWRTQALWSVWHPPVCYVADAHRTEKKPEVHSRLKQVQQPGVGAHQVKLPRGGEGPESGERENNIPLGRFSLGRSGR